MIDTKQLPSLDVQCQITPATITANIDALRVALTTQITEQSATVITVDNLKAGKELAAQMNKTAKAIKDARIQAVKDASVNITEFEVAMTELEKIALDGRAKITEQTARFEAEKLKMIEIILAEALGAEWDKLNIPAEFRKANINGLVMLGSVTAKDALTSKAKAEIQARAAADKALADQTEKRLLLLENESYKAGLAAPLERRHVNQFLFADDETYAANLAQLLEAEKQREAAAIEQRQRQFEQEQQRQAEALERQRQQHEAQQAQLKQQVKEAQQQAAQAQQQVSELQQPVQQQPQRPAIDPAEKAAVLTAAGQVGGVMTTQQAVQFALQQSAGNNWAMIYKKSHNGGQTPAMAAVNGFLFAAVEL